jgi:hypothetical protein
MRRAAVPLPPEEIWLGEPWEDPPAPRRRPRSVSSATPLPPRYRRAFPGDGEEEGPAAPPARRRTAARPAIAPPAIAPPATRSHATARSADDRPPTRPAASQPRTVTIRGRGAERDLSWTAGHARRRPNRPLHERPGFRPDRAAMWAVLLGLLLVLVAATSSHAAVRAPDAAAARSRDGAAPAARVMAVPAVGTVRVQAVSRPRT